MILTAVTVSIDSLLAGIAIGAEAGDGKQKKIFAIMTVVSALCVVSGLLGSTLSSIPQDLAVRFGGLILASLGVIGLLKKNKTTVFVRKRPLNTLREAFLTGFGVGIDGACASLSMLLLGYGLDSTFTVIAFHYLFIETGMILTRFGLKKENTSEKLSSLLLFALGLYKIIAI